MFILERLPQRFLIMLVCALALPPCQAEVQLLETPSTDPISLEILVKGRLSNAVVVVVAIEIEAHADQGSHAEVTIMPDLKSFDHDEFSLDAEIELRAGYGIQNQRLFAGKIQRQRLEISGPNEQRLTLVLQGETSPATSTLPIVRVPFQSVEKLDLDRAVGKHLQGTIATFGTAQVQPGQFIEIEGVGTQFRDVVRVSAVKQVIRNGAWSTIFTLGERR